MPAFPPFMNLLTMRASRSLRLWVCCLFLLPLVACKGGGDGPIKTPPTASVTVASSVPVTAVVTLDGSGSVAKNGGLLIYKWTLTSKPTGSTATISDPAASMPVLTPDLVGTYAVTLVVNEGDQVASVSTSFVATAYTPTTTITADIVEPVSGSVQLGLSSTTTAAVSWTVDGTALNTGSALTTVNLGTPVTWDSTTVANGSHVVVALLQFNGYTLSLSRTFQVSQTTVSFNGATISVSSGVYNAITGAASTNGIVLVSATLDGVAIGSLTAPNACLDSTGVACATTGPNGYNFTGAAGSGSHVIVITATDGAGKRLSTQLPFTV